MIKKILLLAGSFFWLVWAVAQTSPADLKISYKAEGASLQEVFDDLEEAYGIRFSYATESIQTKKLDCVFKAATIEEVIEALLIGQEMDFKIVGDHILLRKTEKHQLQKPPRYQKCIHIKGKVQTEKGGEALGFATVTIAGTSVGTYSNEQGVFDLEIPQKHLNQELIVRYLGYEDQVYQLRDIGEKYLLVALSIGSFGINEVTIVNREKSIVIQQDDNAIRLNKRQLNNQTSGLVGSDLSRQLQLLPGVNASDDSAAAIKIRGSNSDETLMILDGMPLYHSSHYYGIFSAINTVFLEEVDLYKNVFPIHYGGKTAGVVDLKARQTKADSTSFQAELNLLNASLGLDMPLSAKSSLSIAARTTISDVSNTKFNSFTPPRKDELTVQNLTIQADNQTTNPSFRFYDLNGRYLWQPNDKQSLSLNIYSSGDVLKNSFSQAINLKDRPALFLENKEKEQWSSFASSIQYQQQFNLNLGLSSRLFMTRYTNAAYSQFDLIKKKIDEEEDMLNSFGFKQKNEIRDIGLDAHLYLTKAKSMFKLGLAYTAHEVQYEFEDNNQLIFGKQSQINEFSPYGEYVLKLDSGLHLNAGLRGTYYDGTKRFYFSPRLSANWKKGNINFKASYSFYQQFLRELTYEYRGESKQLWVNTDDYQIPVLLSSNIMLGATLRLGPVLLDIEAYQKKMSGILEYTNVEPGRGNTDSNLPRDYALFQGDGWVRGLDVLLSSGYKNYESYISYTLSKTTHRFKEIANSISFPSEDDRRHQFKWVNELKVAAFSFGADYIYSSGRPYNNLRVIGEDGDIRVLDPNARINYLKAYRRLDIGANYSFKIDRYDAQLGVSIFNVLNNRNVKYLQSVVSTVNQNNVPLNVILGNESNLLSRTWNISFKLGL